VLVAQETCLFSTMSQLSHELKLIRGNQLDRLRLGNGIIFNEDNIDLLVDALEQTKSVKEIILCHLDLTSPACKRALAAIIRHNMSIRDLAFNHCVFDDDAWINLATGILRNKTLQEISFFQVESPQGGVGATRFAQVLRHHASITKIRIQIREGSGDGRIPVLLKSLGGSSSITWLDLSTSVVDTETLHFINGILRSNETLTYLDLNHCYIGDNGLKMLLDGIAGNTKLRELKLGCSAITDMISLVPIANRSSFTDVGVTQIANLLGTNTFRVNILHLSGKNIGNCGIRALGRSLEQNQVLKSITLCLENVGSDGMKALFQALQRNKCLEYLCAFKVLGDVVLGEDAAQALAAALTVNKSLKSLSLDGFCLKKEGVLSLAAAMETNHSLYGLKFDAELGEEAKAELEQYIARNMVRAFGSSLLTPLYKAVRTQDWNTPSSLHHQVVFAAEDACRHSVDELVYPVDGPVAPYREAAVENILPYDSGFIMDCGELF
jgi:hypothetical protein